jgi:ferrochelatase
VERVASVPLAQYSARVYAEAMREAASALAAAGTSLGLACAESWAADAGLIEAYTDACVDALAGVDRARTTLVLTAHSLPVAAIRAGDTYESEVRASAAAVARRLAARVGEVRSVVAFQSQGMSTGPGGKPMPWLGPDLPQTIDEARARGDACLVFAPIGFLADHVEILYDLDVEARAWVEERGMTYRRTRSLDDGDALAHVIARIARGLLGAPGAS